MFTFMNLIQVNICLHTLNILTSAYFRVMDRWKEQMKIKKTLVLEYDTAN